MDSERYGEKALEGIKAAVHYTYGARELASMMDKKYSTLMRELSPFDEKAKLSFLDAIAILKLVHQRDKQVLNAIEEDLGVRMKFL